MEIQKGIFGRVVDKHEQRKQEKASAQLAIKNAQQAIIDADNAEIAEQIEAEEKVKADVLAEELRIEEIQKEQDAIDYKASLKPRYATMYTHYRSAPAPIDRDLLNPEQLAEFYNTPRVELARNKLIRLFKRGEHYELETPEHDHPIKMESNNVFLLMRAMTELKLNFI